MRCDKIVWNQEKKIMDIKCPVCEDLNKKTYVLKVVLDEKHSNLCELELYRCNSCSSYFFYPLEDFPLKEDDLRVKFYVEQGAGIDYTIKSIFGVSGNNGIKKALEVGCSFGFGVDYATRILGWDCVGVDPSYCTKVGAKILGIKVYNEYLENCDLHENHFDIIIGSEVIEHVLNPHLFLEAIKAKLSKRGILVLSTPSNEAITPKLDIYSLFQLLYPGSHFIIFSPPGLRKLLEKFKFKNIKIVRKSNQYMLAYASDASLDLNFKGWEYSYIRYLINVFERSKKNGPEMLYNGVAYRLFKELVNMARYRESMVLLSDIMSSLSAKFGEEILFPQQFVRSLDDISDLKEMGSHAPYNLAMLYYYTGVLLTNYLKDYQRAFNFFQGALIVGRKILDLATNYYNIYYEFCGEIVDIIQRINAMIPDFQAIQS